MDYQRLADTVLRNQALLRVDNDPRFGAVAYFRSPPVGRVSMVKLLKNPGMNTKFILDKIASGLLQCFHPGLLAMVNPPQIPYGLFPYSANSKFLAFETFESDLSQLIEQKIEEQTVFSEAQLGTILRKVVSTLHFLWNHNLYHGSISPENILLIHNNPKIVPGLFFEEAGKPSTVKLSPYSPPEDVVVRKNGQPMNVRDPHKVDIFSLGVTLLHAALLNQFIPVYKNSPVAFDEAALSKNLSKLSTKYSVNLVVILQRMTSVNVKNRPDLNQLSDYLHTLSELSTLPSSLTNSVQLCHFGTHKSDPGNSHATPGPCPVPCASPMLPPGQSRMAAARPPPVITNAPKVPHLTINVNIDRSPEELQSRSNSAKLPKLKSSPCKPMQHRLIASPNFTRSATERKKSTMAQSQQIMRLTRMETVAEVDPNQILLTETTPEKPKKIDGGFSDIPEVASVSSHNNVNVADYAAESQILATSIAESRVCSEHSNVAALKDLFNFFPQLRFFNPALRDAPLVEEEITKKSFVGQLTFSTALLKHRLVDKDVQLSGEKGDGDVQGVNGVERNPVDEGAPMAVSTYYQEGASPTSPMRRPDLAASFAESRSNSNDTEEAAPDNIVREQYRDGSVYEGEKHYGKRHGNGVFNFKSGGQYRGAWYNGKMTGKGTLLYPDGTTAYEGDWLEGKFHGRGLLFNEMKQDLKASCLSTYYHNFDDSNAWVKYEGGFSYDLREGTGTITFTDGSQFTGNFRSDKIDGYGKMHLANGDLLEGIWIENRLSQILNASPSSRGLDTPTPCSTRSRLSQRSPRLSPGTPSIGMMMSPISGTKRNVSSLFSTEPVIKPKAC